MLDRSARLYRREPIHLEGLLTEWGRWCVWGRIGPREPSCGSLESGFRAPQVWETAEAKEDAPDWRVGERLERVITRLPARYAGALKTWYVLRPDLHRHGVSLVPDDETWAARRLHVSNARYCEIRRDAETMVENAL